MALQDILVSTSVRGYSFSYNGGISVDKTTFSLKCVLKEKTNRNSRRTIRMMRGLQGKMTVYFLLEK